MKHNISSFIGGLLGVLVLSLNAAHATPTRVGNGDDGTDLESTKKVESGILIETRADAMARVAKLNAQNVPGLGRLLVEIEKSEILLVSRDVKPTAEKIAVVGDVIEVDRAQGLRGMEHDGDTVFARTFPEPVAPTRFFPGALTLDREQLIALHIHEALHRALPEDLREDEGVVSSLTLALAAPDSTHDRVQAAMAKVLYTNRFVKGGRDELVQPMVSPTATSNATLENTSDFWKVKYENAEIQTRIGTQPGAQRDSKIEFLPKFQFSKLGPLSETAFELYVSAALGSDPSIPVSEFNSGPIGGRLSTRIRDESGEKIFAEYRYSSSESASQSLKQSLMTRPIREYGLRYVSKPSTLQWTHYISVIEGSGTRYDRRSRYFDSDGVLSAIEYSRSVDYGSALTAKSEAAFQITGADGSGRGFFLVPVLELVFQQPTRYSDSSNYFGYITGEANDSVDKLGVFGIDLRWQGETMRVGFNLKLGTSSISSNGLEAMGDYWEHGFYQTSAALHVAFVL